MNEDGQRFNLFCLSSLQNSANIRQLPLATLLSQVDGLLGWALGIGGIIGAVLGAILIRLYCWLNLTRKLVSKFEIYLPCASPPT